MEYWIENTRRIQKVIIPPSKSYAQRAILAAALCKNETEILNIGSSQDVTNILKVAQDLGALTKLENGSIRIHGRQKPANVEFNVGESGLGFRLTAAIAAVLFEESMISGSGSLNTRSMVEFESILPQLGLSCRLSGGNIPLRIEGKAKPGKLDIDGSISSQYLSGLLMALPLLNGDSSIIVKELTSRPYINITLDVLKRFNIKIEQAENDVFIIPGNQKYSLERQFIVEGDYSGASIWMVHGAIAEGIKIEGLNPQSVQGDKAILDALTHANVKYNWTGDILEIAKSQIEAFDFDATQCPDLFPALVVLAAAANGISSIKGTNRLIHKESNRATVLQKEFKKLNLKIDLEGDLMRIYGTGKLMSGTIDSNNDHRIAMAGAIAAALTDENVCIKGAESVSKSYPSFWKDFDIN